MSSSVAPGMPSSNPSGTPARALRSAGSTRSSDHQDPSAGSGWGRVGQGSAGGGVPVREGDGHVVAPEPERVVDARQVAGRQLPYGAGDVDAEAGFRVLEVDRR